MAHPVLSAPGGLATQTQKGTLHVTQLEMALTRNALVIPVAVPGSGKTTLLQAAAASIGDPGWRFGPDDVRRLCFSSVSVQRRPEHVHRATRAIVSVRLSVGIGAAYDATSVGVRDRAVLLELARDFGIPAVALLSKVPFEVARARNAARPERDGRVPDFVMDRMEARVRSVTEESLRAEGFAPVYVFDEHTSSISLQLHEGPAS